MSRKRAAGCLNLLFFCAILYACVNTAIHRFSNDFPAERTSSIERGASPRVTLPTPNNRSARHSAEPQSLASLAAPTATPTEAAEPTAAFGIWGVVTVSVLNVREAPSLDAAVVGTLQSGECIELVTEQVGWYGVATEQVGGWASSDYILLVDVCPTTTDEGASASVELDPAPVEIESAPATTETLVADAAVDSQPVAVEVALPSYVGQPFAPSATVAREGWLYECFGQGDDGMRTVGAGTPVMVLGVGDYVPSPEQYARLGDGPYYKVRIWDGQFGWLPTALLDTDPSSYPAVPGHCAEYDSIDWSTVVRPDPPTAVPTVTEPVPEWTRVIATPTSPAPRWTPTSPAPARNCCRICTTGKACGDSCIARNRTCRRGPGCACNG